MVWLCFLLSLVAGFARLRGSDAQAPTSIVADGPWKELPWQGKAHFRPVQVSTGPLLFIHSVDRRLRLVDPERSKAMQDLGDWGDFDSVVDRLDADHALIESNGLAIWQMSSGRTFSVPGEKLVTLDGDECYFFERNKELSGRLGKLTPKGWGWLSPQSFERVIGQTDKSLLATFGDGLFEVGKQGDGVRKLSALPPTTHLDADLSPDRTKIAIGCCAGSAATLLIIDLETGRVLSRRDKMVIPLVGNDFPHLYCAWLDATKIRYLAQSGKALCFRDLDLATGIDVAGATIEINHIDYPDPRSDFAEPSGVFSVRKGKLFCQERDLGAVYGTERFAIEPRGGWAASTGHDLLRLWSSSGSSFPIGPMPFDVGWLPGVGPLERTGVYGLGGFYHEMHRYRWSSREPNVGS